MEESKSRYVYEKERVSKKFYGRKISSISDKEIIEKLSEEMDYYRDKIKNLTEQLKSKITSDNITEDEEESILSSSDDNIAEMEIINKYADNKVYETITRYKYIEN